MIYVQNKTTTKEREREREKGTIFRYGSHSVVCLDSIGNGRKAISWITCLQVITNLVTVVSFFLGGGINIPFHLKNTITSIYHPLRIHLDFHHSSLISDKIQWNPLFRINDKNFQSPAILLYKTMESADEKFVNNVSRKMRMRAHSFSFSLFSETNTNNKNGKRLSKKASKGVMLQQNLNDRMPSLPLQYSGKFEKEEDISRKSHEWNPKIFRKTVKMANESEEFGCCGVPDYSHQSSIFPIKTDSDNSRIPFEDSACTYFQEHDEDTLDMTILLDHTLVPIMTTSTLPFRSESRNSTTRMGMKKMQTEKVLSSGSRESASLKKALPLYSPCYSSASASTASCSSASSSSEANYSKSPQTPITPPSISRTTKAPRPVRSLPSLRSSFGRTNSNSKAGLNHQPCFTESKIDSNSLELYLEKSTIFPLDNTTKTCDPIHDPKHRSPLRERRQKPPLHINATSSLSMNSSSFSPFSEDRAHCSLDQSFSPSQPSLCLKSASLGNPFSPFMSSSQNVANASQPKVTLRMRRSKAALLSPPPCPPPTTPLPVLPSSPFTSKKIEEGHEDNHYDEKEEVEICSKPISNEKSLSSLPDAHNDIKDQTQEHPSTQTLLNLSAHHKRDATQESKSYQREERGFSFQSVASAQFSESSRDSYQTVSRSFYETPMRNSRVLTNSNSNSTNELDKPENGEDQHTASEKAVQVERQILVNETVQETQDFTSDVHIIGYAF